VLRRATAAKRRFGWEPIVENEFIIGCKLDGQSVTLEPGGQFELSGARCPGRRVVCAADATNCRRAGRDAPHDVR